MRNQDRTMVARDVLANIVVAGALVAAAAVVPSATAAADPPLEPPADPAVPEPPPVPEGPTVPMVGAPLGELSPLAQSGAPAAGPFGLPELSDRSQYLLGQNPLPSAPGGPPGTPPSLTPFNNAYLLPQHEAPAAAGEGTVFDVEPGAENADISGHDYLKRVWHLYQGGHLKGSLLGQVPQSQLGEPLPGTAPPPGTNVPAGEGQNLPDPASAPTPEGAPVPEIPPPPG